MRFLRPDGTAEEIEQPGIPLLDTTLLTNSPGEPRIGRQILVEIAAADRIDVVMAFIRRSGVTPLRDALRRHVEAGRSVRVLATTYAGSTEAEALEMLRELPARVPSLRTAAKASLEGGGMIATGTSWHNLQLLDDGDMSPMEPKCPVVRPVQKSGATSQRLSLLSTQLCF